MYKFKEELTFEKNLKFFFFQGIVGDVNNVTVRKNPSELNKTYSVAIDHNIRPTLVENQVKTLMCSLPLTYRMKTFSVDSWSHQYSTVLYIDSNTTSSTL